LREIPLGQIKAEPFDKYLVISLEKKWLDVNYGKPILFSSKLTREGSLVLEAQLEGLASRTRSFSNYDGNNQS
jgi:hypothetical protein